MSNLSFKRIFIFCVFALAALAGAFFISIHSGLAKLDWNTEQTWFIVSKIRLPRTILAFLVGAALSLAGASFQALLKNPLADPHLLGVSAGGALGAVVGSGILIGSSYALSVPLCSLVGSLIAVTIFYRFSIRKGALSLYTLLLIGVVMNSVFVSGIVFIQSVVNTDELTTVLFWLLGNLSFAGTEHLIFIAIVVTICASVLFLQSKKLNILSLSEMTAHSMGVSVERTKRTVFFFAAITTGVAVSMSGMIGFVGLIIPHVARLIVGSDHRALLPACTVIGGIVLILADSFARTVLAPQELPVGVITAFLGAPFFIYFLKRREAKRVI